MLSDKNDRIQKINEALKGFITEKSYMLSGGKVVETDAPGGDKIFGIGPDGDLSKAHVYRGGKKVYLNRPSYNKPLISSTKLGDTQETPPAEAPKKADSLASGIYTAPESNVPVIKQPLLRSEPKSVSTEPKITDPLTSLGGPFKTTATPTAPSAAKPKAGMSRQDMNKALEAVYKYGSTKETPLASRSELEGFTRQDIESARRAAVAPKPKPPATPMTGERTKFQMEPVYTESVENYANYLCEARARRKNPNIKRAVRAKANKPVDETPSSSEQPSALGTIGDLINQAYAPLAPSEPRPVSKEDRTTQREQENAAARARGIAAAETYLKANPKKTGVIASILKILGKSK